MTDDVAIYTPVLVDPLVGRDTAERLFTALVDELEDPVVVDVFEHDGAGIIVFTVTIDGTPIEFADHLVLDADGRIASLTITARPLPGIEALAAAVAPHLGEIIGA